MTNLNSKGEFYENKKVFDYTVHHRMPKIRINKKRRKIAYKGIINNTEAPLGRLPAK
jgi:hypothetical protein